MENMVVVYPRLRGTSQKTQPETQLCKPSLVLAPDVSGRSRIDPEANTTHSVHIVRVRSGLRGSLRAGTSGG